MTKTGRHLLWGGLALGAVTIGIIAVCATIAFREMQSCKHDSGQRAVESCSKIIAHHGTAAWAYANRGNAYTGLHQNKLALDDFATAIRLNPGDPTAWYGRGFLHTALKQYPAAIADLTTAIRLQPKADKALEVRAAAFTAMHDYERATGDLSAALRLRQGDADLRGERGMVYLAAEQYELAIRDFDAAEHKYPHNGPLNFFRAVAYFELHQYDDALRNLDDSIRIGATAERLEMRCFVRAVEGHQLDGAKTDCDRAAKLDPKRDQLFDRGVLFLRMGKVHDAVVVLDKALRARPDDANARYLRGLAKTKDGDRAGGNADIKAAKTRDPKAVERLVGFGL